MSKKINARDRLPNVAAAAVILLAGALSTAWAFIVPIFQAPDEPAHFDYAMSIYSAGRLVTLADGRSDWIVSPYTRYLMAASDFDRIVGHSSMRAPRDYATRSYFARIDSEAADVRATSAPPGRISYIVRLYPFLFYALEALWMATVSTFTKSIVAMFFSARILCVLFMMVGLYFNYRTARNLGIGTWLSVGFIAAIGFFPMVSFVAAYVQPDNLTYALVSATLFFSTELHRRLSAKSVIGLGLSLGLLVVTKYHFFIAAALPTVFLFAVVLSRCRLPLRKKLAASTILAAPTIVLLLIQCFVINHTGRAVAQHPHQDTFAQLHAVLTTGVPALARHLAVTGAAAFTDFFAFGPCAATYWQTLGWVDTPLVIVNASVSMLVRSVIALLTVATVVALAFLTLRNLARLFAASVKGHARGAMIVVASDPVYNSYLCFTLLMFSLYVLTDNVFGAEGRHWYPYVFAAFLSFIWYAPRTLFKRHQAVSALLTIILCSYSAVALAFAAGDVWTRYYGPPQGGFVARKVTPGEILTGTVPGALRPLQDAAYHVNVGSFPSSFQRGTRIAITGAVLPNGSGPTDVAVIVDNRISVPVLSGQYDFRAAEFMHDINDGYSGFSGVLDTDELGAGAHTITAYAMTRDGSHYQRITPTRIFFITAPDGRIGANKTGPVCRSANCLQQ